MNSLVIKTKNELKMKLITELYKEELFDKLLYENETISIRRAKCRKDIAFLKQARNILREAQDYDLN
jgi:dynamin 1-like protein